MNDIHHLLDLVNEEIEKKHQLENKERKYLGMSAIGHKCARKLWYDLHRPIRENHKAETINRFNDGHRSEEIMATLLSLVPGVKLQTIDLRGDQIGFSDFGDKFRGHVDGILEYNNQEYIWEHKCVNDIKYNKMLALTAFENKNALEQWDHTYFSQAQCYMHYSNIHQHYMTIATPGTRSYTYCLTKYDEDYAAALINKAKRIILARVPLARVSNKPDYYLCDWCQYKDVCHGDIK